MMSPGTAVPPDPRAYVRIAGVLREVISSRSCLRARPRRASPGFAASMAMPGRPAEGRCACWRTRVCCTAFPGSAITSQVGMLG